MSKSFSYPAVNKIHKQILELSSNLNSTNPPVAQSLMILANGITTANEEAETARINSILKGMHPALQPIKQFLYLQGDHRKFDMVSLFNEGDKSISEGSNSTTASEALRHRQVGVIYRRIYAMYGCEEEVGARRLFNPSAQNIPDGYYITKGSLVFDFDDGHGFQHYITLDKQFCNKGNSLYRVRSKWMDEEFKLDFRSIGQAWINQYILQPMCDVWDIKPEEWMPLPLAELIEHVNTLENVGSILHFHRMTMRYPGSAEHHIPEGRIELSYHYYAGSDKHQLIANFFPEKNSHLVGVFGDLQRHITYDNLPTPLQQWIKENIHQTMTDKLIEEGIIPNPADARGPDTGTEAEA